MGFDGMGWSSLAHRYAIFHFAYCIVGRPKIAEFSKATSRGKSPKKTFLWLSELRIPPQGIGRRDTEQILTFGNNFAIVTKQIFSSFDHKFWGGPIKRGVGEGTN